MAINIYNFDVYQGAKLDAVLNVVNSDATPTNLSGYAIRGYVKHRYSSPNRLAELNLTLINNGTGGQISCILNATGTSGFAAGTFPYCIEAIPPAGETGAIKIIRGGFRVNPETTY